MPDGNVNKYADAVIEAARLRLVGDTDKALDVLNDLMQPGSSEGIRLKAATETLDRAGVRGGFEVKVEQEITVNPSDEIGKRLAKLRAGAEAVTKMQAEATALHEEHDDVVDAELISDEPDTVVDPDEGAPGDQ